MLTARQRQILELIAQRRSLKQIANDLDLSISSVDKHVKALKLELNANSLSELAERHRSLVSAGDDRDYSFSASGISAVTRAAAFEHPSDREDFEAGLILRDAAYRVEPPWQKKAVPEVVPGWLTGPNATLTRTALIVGIALGLLALVLIGLGVAQGISGVLQ